MLIGFYLWCKDVSGFEAFNFIFTEKNQNNVQISNIIFITEKFQSQNKVESVMNTIQEKRKEKKQKVHDTKKKISQLSNSTKNYHSF